jgi:tRNA(His) guanylyltransferase
MFDNLGDRMKKLYEKPTRITLPGRTYTLIRVDGKAFHTYTKGLQRPFDLDLIADMDNTAAYLCANIQGAKFAFVQSDEISILLTDFESLTTQSWFEGNLQKMCSISASYATAIFNQLRVSRGIEKLAHFDSRVFQIAAKVEVENYMIWRQQDTVRNSIASVAQNLYSPKELNGKGGNEQQEMIFQKGINWNDYAPELKRGRLIVKEQYQKGEALRTRWISIPAPIFTQDRDSLSQLIPNY